MSKIIVEEFDVCHKFMESCVQHILPFNEREFVSLTHLVSCDEFIIFLSYDKEKFGNKTQQFVQDMIKETQKSDLYKYNWKVHQPLVLDELDLTCYRFPHCINIILPVE